MTTTQSSVDEAFTTLLGLIKSLPMQERNDPNVKKGLEAGLTILEGFMKNQQEIIRLLDSIDSRLIAVEGNTRS